MEEALARPVDPIVFSVTRLDLFGKGTQSGYATGFFYLRNDLLYLVTNRHVLEGEEGRPHWTNASIELHTTPSVYDHRSFRFSLLRADGAPVWRAVPRPADIAVLPLDRAAIEAGAHITWFTPNMIFPVNYVLELGEDAFLMGYPRSLRDDPANLPIFRKAMVASTYGVSFQREPYFLTDGHFHEGLSGSPVVVKPRHEWRDIFGRMHQVSQPGHFLLGVHSGLYQPEIEGEGYVDLQLGRAWYPGAIDNAIDQ